MYKETSVRQWVRRFSVRFRSVVLDNTFVEAFRSFFCVCMECEVTAADTLRLLHAHVACAALFLLGGLSVRMAVLLLVWFVLSVVLCHRQWNR